MIPFDDVIMSIDMYPWDHQNPYENMQRLVTRLSVCSTKIRNACGLWSANIFYLLWRSVISCVPRLILENETITSDHGKSGWPCRSFGFCSVNKIQLTSSQCPHNCFPVYTTQGIYPLSPRCIARHLLHAASRPSCTHWHKLLDKEMTWWSYCRKEPATLLALCEGTAPVTTGFPSRMTCNRQPWFGAMMWLCR